MSEPLELMEKMPISFLLTVMLKDCPLSILPKINPTSILLKCGQTRISRNTPIKQEILIKMKNILFFAALFCFAFQISAEKLPEIICGIYGNYTIRPENDAALADFEKKFLIPMQKAGFNTVDLKIHDFTRSPELFQKNLHKIADTVNKHGMQLCIYTYFPIVRKSNSPYSAAVDGNGRLQKRFYNVLAPGLWHDLLKSARRIAALRKK